MNEMSFKQHFHVVIVGGGLVGLSMALALSSLGKRDNGRVLTIGLIETFPSPENDYNPENDPRTTALSFGTRLIYETLGIWMKLKPYAQPIRHIHVSDKGALGISRLYAKDYNVPSLGYVVPNKQLLKVLSDAVENTNITLLRPASVESLNMSSQLSLLDISQDNQQKTLSTELIILADGGRSSLMKQMGFEPKITHYHHTGILATITHSQPHNCTAYERFTDEGPMALLPIMPGKQYKSALIWTMPNETAQERLQLVDKDFLDELQARFGMRTGRFEHVGKRSGFPLMLKLVPEPARQGGILLGNSAHSLHPVAGQGYNLALRDVVVLASILTETSEKQSLSDLNLLQNYLRYQQQDQADAITFSDQLVQAFSNNNPLLKAGRNTGLLILDTFMPLKQWFGYKSMGLGGYGR